MHHNVHENSTITITRSQRSVILIIHFYISYYFILLYLLFLYEIHVNTFIPN